MQKLAKTLFLVCSLFWVRTQAFSYPEMIRHGYVNCTSCHVSPTGGGTLTEYGRSLAEEVMSSWSAPGEARFLYGTLPTNQRFQFGGDIRGLVVLSSEGGRGLDDITVAFPGNDPADVVNVLNAIGRYLGNKDGVITEEKWNLWLDHMVTAEPTGLFSLNLAGEKPTVGWRFEKGFESVIPTPIIHNGILYSVKNGGILTAFDANTGEVTKTARIPGALGGYSASPVFAAGNLYFANEEGKVAVIRPGRQWELVQLNDLKEEIFATPAFSAGRIYLRTADALYCFSK